MVPADRVSAPLDAIEAGHDVGPALPIVVLRATGSAEPVASPAFATAHHDPAATARLRRDAGARPDATLALAVDERGVIRGGFILEPGARFSAVSAAASALADALLAAPQARPAPVLVRPDALDAQTCAELVATLENDWVRSGQRTGATAPLQPMASLKWRRDHVLGPGRLHDAVQRQLAERVLPAVEQSFAYRVRAHEGFKIVAYDAPRASPPGAAVATAPDAPFGHFARHRDNRAAGTEHRRFALSLGLGSAYRGGRLVFPEFNDDGLRLETGQAAVFSASLLHAVTPVTHGTRYALVSFLW